MHIDFFSLLYFIVLFVVIYFCLLRVKLNTYLFYIIWRFKTKDWNYMKSDATMSQLKDLIEK